MDFPFAKNLRNTIVSIINGMKIALKRMMKFFLFFSIIINIKNKKIKVKIMPTGFSYSN